MSTGLLRRLAERGLGTARRVRSTHAMRDVTLPPAGDIEVESPSSGAATPAPDMRIIVEHDSTSRETGRAKHHGAPTQEWLRVEHVERTQTTPSPSDRGGTRPVAGDEAEAIPATAASDAEPRLPTSPAANIPAPLLPTQPARWSFIAQPAARVAERRSAAPRIEVPNEVHVSIGRVELVGAPSHPTPARRPSTPKGGRSLEDYLRPHEKGGA